LSDISLKYRNTADEKGALEENKQTLSFFIRLNNFNILIIVLYYITYSNLNQE